MSFEIEVCFLHTSQMPTSEIEVRALLSDDSQIIQLLASFSLGAGGKPVFSWITYWYN